MLSFLEGRRVERKVDAVPRVGDNTIRVGPSGASRRSCRSSQKLRPSFAAKIAPNITDSADEKDTERCTFENQAMRQRPKKKRPPDDENFTLQSVRRVDIDKKRATTVNLRLEPQGPWVVANVDEDSNGDREVLFARV